MLATISYNQTVSATLFAGTWITNKSLCPFTFATSYTSAKWNMSIKLRHCLFKLFLRWQPNAWHRCSKTLPTGILIIFSDLERNKTQNLLIACMAKWFRFAFMLSTVQILGENLHRNSMNSRLRVIIIL